MIATRRAVSTRGHVAWGETHGEAFGNLPDSLKGGQDFLIGRYHPELRRFEGDGHVFWHKRIAFVRHGDVLESHLSESGIAQARHVASKLSRSAWSGIYASPCLRTLETAGLLREILHSRVLVSIDLADHDESGVLDDHRREFPEFEWVTDLKVEPEDKISHVFRILDWLPDRSIAVTHADLIAGVAALITGLSFDVSPGSLTVVDGQTVEVLT